MQPRSYLHLAALVTIVPWNSAQAVLLAHWQFEDGPGFLNDSSGNGYHLQDPGIAGFAAPTFAADKAAAVGGAGSAQFNGVSSFTQSAIPLSLSSYDHVRFSYWMKVEAATSDMMVFENSFDTNFQVNTGSTFHLANASGVGGGGKTLIAHRTTTGFSSAATTLDVGPAQTQPDWHFIQVEYDFGEPVADERIKIFVDGVEGSTLRSISDAHTWEHLHNDVMYVGGRREFSGNPSLLFQGKLDDVRIEAIPEPATATLFAGLTLAVAQLSRRRRA